LAEGIVQIALRGGVSSVVPKQNGQPFLQMQNTANRQQ